MTFGEKLKALRDQRQWSQQQLADAAGVSVWAIRDYEQGKRRFDPGLRLLVKLSRALREPLDVFADCASDDDTPSVKAKNPAAKRGGKRKTA
jgi:transcriptional regulator with XRE-family HTH domain